MIRTSAALVGAALAVLIAGVLASSLLVIYISIGLSGVAAIVLGTAMARRRGEIFGGATAAEPVAHAQAGLGWPAVSHRWGSGSGRGGASRDAPVSARARRAGRAASPDGRNGQGDEGHAQVAVRTAGAARGGAHSASRSRPAGSVRPGRPPEAVPGSVRAAAAPQPDEALDERRAARSRTAPDGAPAVSGGRSSAPESTRSRSGEGSAAEVGGGAAAGARPAEVGGRAAAGDRSAADTPGPDAARASSAEVGAAAPMPQQSALDDTFWTRISAEASAQRAETGGHRGGTGSGGPPSGQAGQVPAQAGGATPEGGEPRRGMTGKVRPASTPASLWGRPASQLDADASSAPPEPAPSWPKAPDQWTAVSSVDATATGRRAGGATGANGDDSERSGSASVSESSSGRTTGPGRAWAGAGAGEEPAAQPGRSGAGAGEEPGNSPGVSHSRGESGADPEGASPAAAASRTTGGEKVDLTSGPAADRAGRPAVDRAGDTDKAGKPTTDEGGEPTPGERGERAGQIAPGQTGNPAPHQAGVPAGGSASRPATDGGSASDKPASDKPASSEDVEVVIVPGIGRYHRTGCILIRFLGSGDLETMTRGAAETEGCVPCRACQPELLSAGE
jgi:hypothetical protein